MNKVSGIFVHEQVKALKKLGCDIRVISPVPAVPFPLSVVSKKWKRYSKIQKIEEISDIKAYYPRMIMLPRDIIFHNSGKIYFHSIKQLLKGIYKEFPFDIVHCHTALPDGYAGSLVAQLYNKPIVTTIHGNDFQNTIHKSEKSKNAIVHAIKYSNKVVTVSNKLKNIGLSLFPDTNKFITVHNGVDLKNVHNCNKDLYEKYKNKKVILSVGNLINSKGHDITIKAYKEILKTHIDVHLIIIGGGEELTSLKTLINELGIEDSVELLGQMPHEKVMSYMEICTLFVLPSWKEGFGVVYVEAMAHGKAVIGCKEEGIQDIINNWENGVLVNKKDIEDLTKSITVLLDNNKLRGNIEENAKKTVFDNLQWENNAEKYFKIYNELINDIQSQFLKLNMD
ncbi:glycosyltransferase [Clostridium swellfunianum]|nr:glycosyltransferase [Clostridium swellfunianum]